MKTKFDFFLLFIGCILLISGIFSLLFFGVFSFYPVYLLIISTIIFIYLGIKTIKNLN